MTSHLPVLLHEVLDLMNVQPSGTYIDATFGRGGHTRAILERLDASGRCIAFDRDPAAVSAARELARDDPRFSIEYAPFSSLETTCDEQRGAVDGILLDIGVSSPQLDDAARGFSFRFDGPLDMRMDPAHGVSAADWLAATPEREIADVLWQLGEERRSRQIARRIVETRTASPIRTTADLAALVRSCVFQRGHRIDPATRTFQAIRMHVNDELGELELALEGALRLLAPGGRLLVIAFHSLEDRIVKQRFRALDDARREAERERHELAPAYRAVTRKPVMAGEVETATNPRARSARLRVLERLR